jgi:hypothetical protein
VEFEKFHNHDCLKTKGGFVMNTNYTHLHCVLERNGSTQVSFIPSKFAQKGRYLKLKEDGKWIDGWLVTATYPPLISSETIEARSRDHANHRKVTDI